MQFTVPAVLDAVAAAIGDRVLLTQGDRRYTYAEVVERSNRLASYLHSRGPRLPHRADRRWPATRSDRTCWASTPTTATSSSSRCSASFRARVAPFNVNYRYVKNELQYLLADAGATALVYHAAFAPRVAEILPDLPHLRVLIQIADGSGNDLLDGAVDYEEALAVRRADSRRRSSRRPTTSTCSTPAAPPGCPRACCGASTTSS